MTAGFGWVLATLIASAAQTARNATQASLTRAIGTIGATQVRFLFGLPFAVIFLALVALVTGEAVPALTARTIGFTTAGALAQIAATALMLRTMKSQSFAVMRLFKSGPSSARQSLMTRRLMLTFSSMLALATAERTTFR